MANGKPKHQTDRRCPECNLSIWGPQDVVIAETATRARLYATCQRCGTYCKNVPMDGPRGPRQRGSADDFWWRFEKCADGAGPKKRNPRQPKPRTGVDELGGRLTLPGAIASLPSVLDAIKRDSAEVNRAPIARKASGKKLRSSTTTIAGVDIAALVYEYWNLPSVVLARKAHGTPSRCPGLTTTRRRRETFGAAARGLAYPAQGPGKSFGHRLHITASDECNPIWLRHVVLHEVCHCALPSGISHGIKFRRLLCEATNDVHALGINPSDWSLGPARGCKAYSLDSVIGRALRVADQRGCAPSVVMESMRTLGDWRNIKLAHIVAGYDKV